jgi:hypothetical protein
MAEISYYDADLSDAIEKLNEMMGKLAKAPPGIKPEVQCFLSACNAMSIKTHSQLVFVSL